MLLLGVHIHGFDVCIHCTCTSDTPYGTLSPGTNTWSFPTSDWSVSLRLTNLELYYPQLSNLGLICDS